MQERTTDAVAGPADSANDVRTGILRDGAQKLLAAAIEAEVAGSLEEHAEQRDGNGHRLVVRNGHRPQRTLHTGIGPVTIRQPRVNDRRTDESGQRIRFTSKAVQDGFRESRHCGRSGCSTARPADCRRGPELDIGDGAPGFRKALAQVFGTTREQRCWVHKTANVLNHLPKSKQGKAKGMLHAILDGGYESQR